MRMSADDDDEADQQHKLADPGMTKRPFSARYAMTATLIN